MPPAGGEESLYLRPYIFATEPGLGVRPASEYRYMVIASPAGAYFPRGIKPVSVWLSHEYVRAAPGGTVTLVSHASGAAGTTANGFSDHARISGDGAYITFLSAATDLVAGVTDANGSLRDVFLYAMAPIFG